MVFYRPGPLLRGGPQQPSILSPPTVSETSLKSKPPVFSQHVLAVPRTPRRSVTVTAPV